MDDTLTTSMSGFDKTGDVLYLIDSRGRDTGALKTHRSENRRRKNHRRKSAGRCRRQVMEHPTENTIQAVSFTYDRPTMAVFR